MNMGGKDEEEESFCFGGNHREAEGGDGSSRSGQHGGRGEQQARGHGADLVSIEGFD